MRDPASCAVSRGTPAEIRFYKHAPENFPSDGEHFRSYQVLSLETSTETSSGVSNRRFKPETEIKGMDKSIVVNERARSAHSTMREQGSAAFDGRRRVEPDPPGGMSESSFPRPNINLHCVISDTDPRTINHIYQRRSMQLPPVLEFGCGNFHSTPGDSPA